MPVSSKRLINGSEQNPARERSLARERSPVGDRDLVIVHSSDLHVGDVMTTEAHGGDDTLPLRRVLDAAEVMAADLVLLAGDVFEHNRLPAELLERSAAILGQATMPVVVLPGNHDPATADSVYRRGEMADVSNLSVLGVTHDHAVLFPGLELEVWGRAHIDYDDMVPLRSPKPRETRWQIAMAHGHYHPQPDRGATLNPAWLIGRDEIAATAVDYLALGHWNRPTRVSRGTVPAYYSGSPELSDSVNVVRLKSRGDITVRRRRLPEIGSS